MATQLILTVGTNPLPVWVAWHHLKDILERPVSVGFVYTSDTQDEKERLECCCQGANFGRHIQTSSGNPGIVRENVRVILDNLDEITHLHLHYTGGTKVMSVEAVAALEYDLPANITLETSYLDPRGDSGPSIVNSHGRTLAPDTRVGVPADLARVAHLNGFTLGPFVHEYWDGDSRRYVRVECLAPARPSDEQERMGNTTLGAMARFAPGTITSKNFEYAAYVALKEALEQIKDEERRPRRDNYNLFHSVNVRRTGANQRDPHFELDVVAVLGYQVIVVSCTLATEHSVIKRKGMEAILRARQLGGDEAQAIVLCQAHRQNTQRLERELHDEVGSVASPLRIWGKNMWTNLSEQFYRYLRTDLHWM